MIKIHQLPIAVAALTAASPVLAHETDFFHTHTESLAWVAGLGVVGVVAYRIFRSIARK
ncbi:MAG: hypothetical protein AAGB23_04965 [Pseudomonadota bacterium]